MQPFFYIWIIEENEKNIFTKRTIIRSIMNSDAEFILQLLNTDNWIRNIGDRGVRTIEDSKSFISKILNTPNFEYNVIEKLNSKQPIGILSFIKRDHFDFPDFGFALLPEFCNKGFAYEASIGYLKNLFSLNLNLKVIAICKNENAPSIKLLENLGFTYSSQVNENLGEKLILYSINKQHFCHK